MSAVYAETIDEIRVETAEYWLFADWWRAALDESDRLLGLTEVANRDERPVPADELERIEWLAEAVAVDLPELTRPVEAVDAVFEVQEALLAFVRPSERADLDYTEADLLAWEARLRWLEQVPGGVRVHTVTPGDAKALAVMHAHGLVFIWKRVAWRAYQTWPERIGRLRRALEVGCCG